MFRVSTFVNFSFFSIGEKINQKLVIRQFDVIDKEMKKNDELSSVELQRILLACYNITVSMRVISSQWNALSRSQWNAFLFGTHSNSTEILAFPQRSISHSIRVPVTRSLLGYFRPVLYLKCNCYRPLRRECGIACMNELYHAGQCYNCTANASYMLCSTTRKRYITIVYNCVWNVSFT